MWRSRLTAISLCWRQWLQALEVVVVVVVDVVVVEVVVVVLEDRRRELYVLAVA